MPEIQLNKLNTILNDLQGKRVVVLGDLMIDEYLWGKVRRLSPEAPVPIVALEKEALRFGGAANVALNLQTLGVKPVLLGLVGEDRMGDNFFNLLQQNHLSHDGIITASDRPTTVKTRIIGETQHLARVDREVNAYIDDYTADEIIKRFEKLIEGADAVIYEDYNKGVLNKKVIRETIRLAEDRKIITSVDPKFINFMEYQRVTLFKPNIKEAARALAAVIETDEDIQKAGFQLMEQLSSQHLLLTLGSRGIMLFNRSGKINHIPTKTRKVADVSGAGDTVISMMTAALCGGASFYEAAYLANFAAGIVCEEVGVVPINIETLKARIAKEGG
ncbi:MAG: D-glycero-beta-D-manno-heptose-7-phosphate kinase [Caldithrix sp.]|nr:D-glycero-beta-D-manno-heptose-7-phosphate kinase [Caldithrix sp.]